MKLSTFLLAAALIVISIFAWNEHKELLTLRSNKVTMEKQITEDQKVIKFFQDQHPKK